MHITQPLVVGPDPTLVVAPHTEYVVQYAIQFWQLNSKSRQTQCPNFPEHSMLEELTRWLLLDVISHCSQLFHKATYLITWIMSGALKKALPQTPVIFILWLNSSSNLHFIERFFLLWTFICVYQCFHIFCGSVLILLTSVLFFLSLSDNACVHSIDSWVCVDGGLVLPWSASPFS